MTALVGSTSGRRRLPNRRAQDVFPLDHDGCRDTAGLGHFENGTLAEVFLNSAKTATDLATADQGAAMAVPLALQHGCSVEAIRLALARNSNGMARDIVGAVPDHLTTEAIDAPGRQLEACTNAEVQSG